MSSSCRVVSLASVACVPLILSLWGVVGEGAPLGLGILSNFLDIGNGTSLLAELALAHIEHKLDTLGALADLAGIVVNVTGSGRPVRKKHSESIVLRLKPFLTWILIIDIGVIGLIE